MGMQERQTCNANFRKTPGTVFDPMTTALPYASLKTLTLATIKQILRKTLSGQLVEGSARKRKQSKLIRKNTKLTDFHLRPHHYAYESQGP